MKNIRNFFLVGAIGSGKTSFVEQILFNEKKISRAGSVNEGNTMMDFSPKEIENQKSIHLSIAQFEKNKTKINLIDTPGSPDFVGEQMVSTKAAESTIILANSTKGFEPGLELAMDKLELIPEICKAIVINKLDLNESDFFRTLREIKEHSNVSPAPICIPIGEGTSFKGVVHLIKMKAFIDGKECEIPKNMETQVEKSLEFLTEAVAETSEEMLDIFIETGTLSQEHMLDGLKKGIINGSITPVFACSVSENIALDVVLDSLIRELPSPEEENQISILKNDTQEIITSKEDGKVLAYIFKTISDNTLGNVSYVRVYSGELKTGSTLFVPENGNKVKIGSIYKTIGKKRFEVPSLGAGEIGALVKLKNCGSLCTLTEFDDIKKLPPTLPSAYVWKTIKATSQKDENKIGEALEKLLEEDKTLHLDFNQLTGQSILSGLGMKQLTLVQERLLSDFNVSCDLLNPKVAYKETISKPSQAHYRHKKQSGGRGQFAEVYFRMKPTKRGHGFEFVSSIVGGSIPHNFIPAIEKGLMESLGKGVIAGCPVVDVSVDVYDGSFHAVDSCEAAFKTAASHAFKEGFLQGKPIILEPIHNVFINVPAQFMGDIISDLSGKRGKILGMEQKGKNQIISAELPLSELFGYFPNLKSLTQGRGRFTQEFSHYQVMQDILAKNVMDEHSKAH